MPGFFGRVVSLVVDSVKVQNSRRSSASSLFIFWSPSDGKVGKGWNWLIIWMEFSLFNFHTLDITVTAKSHWFPQLLPIIYKCYLGTFVWIALAWTLITWFLKSFNFIHILFIITSMTGHLLFIIFILGYMCNIYLIFLFLSIWWNTADIVVSNSSSYNFMSLFCFPETVSTDRSWVFLLLGWT